MNALPVVVKLGGSCLEQLTDDWWDDLARHVREHRLVLVHGWSKPLKNLNPRYTGPEAVLRDRFGNQSRWTTPEVLADIHTVSDELTAAVAALLDKRGIGTTRVLGSDGVLRAGPGERWYWRGRQLVELDNLVGPIAEVDTTPLAGPPPGDRPGVHLVTPLARDPQDREVNTDGDRAAAAVAGGVGAAVLVLVTDVPFLLVDGEPVRRIGAQDAARFRDRGATGGMRKKLRAAGEALDRGVERVVIGNAPLSELLAGSTGTVITR
ncbi:MAG: acetylglutamate kinase [Saccharothrix sp.]|nr:acetylglutamate kinase [Saccharothrix sp.]